MIPAPNCKIFLNMKRNNKQKNKTPIQLGIAALFAVLMSGFVPHASATEEIIWRNTDASSLWLGDIINGNWWHSGSSATAGFASGNAVVFGRATDGAPITSGTVTIGVGGVTIGAVGTNPGMTIESGTWTFIGGALNGGGIKFTGNGALAFDTRTLTQRMEVGNTVTASLAATEGATLTITAAPASTNGGALTIGSGAAFTANSSDTAKVIFENNRSSASGGAISGNNASVTLNGALFTSNTATNSTNHGGGAIMVANSSTLTITSGTFQSNYSAGSGGAIFARGGSRVNISNATFTGNKADALGGAITAWESPSITLTDVSFINNTHTFGGVGGAVYINATQNGAYLHTTDFAINVSADKTSTYSGNGSSFMGIVTPNSIGFGGLREYAGFLHTVNMTVDVASGGLLDMQDPMRVRPNHPTAGTKYDSLRINITKNGEGVWRLGGRNLITGTAGNTLAVQKGELALYAGASVLLDNQGNSTDAAAVEDTFTLASGGTLSSLGITTTGAAAAATATGAVTADTITLADGASLAVNSNLVLSATTLNFGEVATTSDKTAKLTLDQKSGGLALSGTRTFAVADAQTLTVAGRVVTQPAATLTLEAVNTTGTRSGTTAITAPVYASFGGAVQVTPGATFNARASNGASLAFVSNTATLGGAIWVENGNLNLDGVSFRNNTSSAITTGAGGGAILASNNSTLNIASGTFANNTAGNHGGAIFGSYGNNATIASSLFTSNTAIVGNGGAITSWNATNFTLTDVSFTNNTAGGYGGALYINAANAAGFISNVNINVSASATSTYSGNKDTFGARASGIYFGGFDNDFVNLNINVAAGGVLDMQDPMGVRPEWPLLHISATKTGAGTWKLGGDTLLSGTTGNTVEIAAGALELYAGASLTLDNQSVIAAAGNNADTFTLNSAAALTISSTAIDGSASYADAAIHADTISLSAGSVLNFDVGTTIGVDSGSTCPATGAPITTGATGTAGALVLTGSVFDYSAGGIKVNASITSYAEGNNTITLIDATGMSGLSATGTLDTSKFSLLLNGVAAVHNNRLDVHQLQSTAGNMLDLFYHSTGNGVVVWTGSQNTTWDESARNWSFNYNGTAYDQFLNGDTVVFGDTTGGNITIGAAGVTITPSGTNPGMLVAGQGNWSFDGGSINEGATPAAILMQGTGTLTLSASNNYSGGTKIETGTVVAKKTAALGTGDIDNKASLVFDIASGAADTLAQKITNTGTTTKTGAGTLTNTGAIQNALVVNAGSLVNSGNITGATTIQTGGTLVHKSGTLAAITAEGMLNFDNAAAYTQTAVIGGSGKLVKNGAGDLVLSATNTFTGATEVNQGTLKLAVTNALAQSSTVSIGATATLDLAGQNQTLKHLKPASGARININSTGGDYRALSVGTLSGDGGVFAMRTDIAANQGDKLNITGSSSGAHKLDITNTGTGEILPDAVIPVVVMASAGATFSGTTESGMRTLTVQQGDGGLFMPDANTWYLGAGDSLSRAGQAILATAATAGQDWLYELDSLSKRMGDLHAYRPAAGSGNLWGRVSTYKLEADADLTGAAFDQTATGFTFGMDETFPSGINANWYLGLFGNINKIDRDFSNHVGDGETNSYGGGIYATWLNSNGWYADIIARYDRRKNEFNARGTDGFVTQGKYNTNAYGLSLEYGRRVALGGWWIEPSVQGAATRIGDAGYETFVPNQDAIRVAIESLTAVQGRAQVRLGGALRKWPSFLPYARIAIAYATSSGGRIDAADYSFTPDTDGWRAEGGLGAAYTIDPKSQLYLDYEYAKADLYERPWAINFGYRRNW